MTGVQTCALPIFDVPADVLAGSSQVTASITTTDAAGNSSTANSTHTFNTDLLAPTITINGETSNNGVNSLARAGDVITTTFTSTDTVTSVTIGGHTVTATPVIGQANTYTASYTVQTNDSGPTNVVVTSIDAAGNTATETFNGLVTIDTVAPTITINGEASNNATTTLAKAGDVITTTFTSTDPVTSVTIGGHTVTATPVIGQANTYTASYTVQTSDNAGSTNVDRKSTRLNSSHMSESRMPSSA